MNDILPEETAAEDETGANTGGSFRRKRRRRRGERAGPVARVLLFFVTLAVWSPLLFSPVLWSEYDRVERTAYPQLEDWTDAWRAGMVRQEDPLSLSSYFWEQALPLPPPTVHRAVNLGLHLLSVFLLLAALEALRVRHAWVAAFLFAVHPGAAQALFWPGYRPVLLGLVLVLGALFLAIRNRNARDYGLALGLAALACLVHPAAYAMPLILALVVTLDEYPPALGDYNRVLPFAFVALFAALAMAGRGWAGASADAGGFVETVNTGGLNLIYFLRETALPFEPALFQNYASVRAGEYRGDTFLPFFFLLPSVILIVVFLRQRWARALLLGLGAFLLLAAPGLFSRGLSPGGLPAFETHGLYPALPAAAALAAAGAGFLLRKMGPASRLIWPHLAIIPIAALLLVSVLFAREIRDEDTLWRHLTTAFPEDWAGREALAVHLLEHPGSTNDPEDVVRLLNSVLIERPDRIHLRVELARLYLRMDQQTNAIREYQRVLFEASPDPEFLREAAEVFRAAGMSFEARKALDRIEDD